MINGRTIAIIGNHQVSGVAIKARFKMKWKKTLPELKRSRNAKFRGLHVSFVWLLISLNVAEKKLVSWAIQVLKILGEVI